MLEVWRGKMDHAFVPHQQVEFLLRNSVRLEDMIREHKSLNRYPAALADEFLNSAEQYLQLTSGVARHYTEAGRKLFDVTTKCHMLWHCAYSARFLNPALSWCYMGEDNMQHVRRIAASALRGTPSWMVGRKVLDKWLRGFTFRLVRMPQRQQAPPAAGAASSSTGA